jgi:hypothetical protein
MAAFRMNEKLLLRRRELKASACEGVATVKGGGRAPEAQVSVCCSLSMAFSFKLRVASAFSGRIQRLNELGYGVERGGR